MYNRQCLILLTFAYLPLSVTKTAVADLRPLITVGFGLIHGFGFASALIELGLSDTQLWPALLGFNVGIELGPVPYTHLTLPTNSVVSLSVAVSLVT